LGLRLPIDGPDFAFLFFGLGADFAFFFLSVGAAGAASAAAAGASAAGSAAFFPCFFFGFGAWGLLHQANSTFFETLFRYTELSWETFDNV